MAHSMSVCQGLGSATGYVKAAQGGLYESWEEPHRFVYPSSEMDLTRWAEQCIWYKCAFMSPAYQKATLEHYAVEMQSLTRQREALSGPFPALLIDGRGICCSPKAFPTDSLLFII